MTTIGHLCIISDDAHRADALKTTFEASRYHVDVYATANNALVAFKDIQPDVVLISSSLTGMSAEEFVDKLHADAATSYIPVAVDISENTSLDTWRSDNEGFPIVNDILPYGLDADATVYRLQPLFRLSTMAAELTLRQTGNAVVKLPSIEQISGDTSRCFYLSLNPALNLPVNFSNGNTLWETAASIAEADAMITGPGFFDVVIIDGTLAQIEDILQFCNDMRDNPRLFNLPFLIRIPDLIDEDIKDLYQAGANRVLSNADCEKTLQYEALSLIKLQVSRNLVRDTLRRTLTESTGHPLEAVYTESFLRGYLDKRIELAKSRNRALSVVHLHLPEAASLYEEAGASACRALSEQLGRWLSRLIRVEDLAARIDDSNFVVVLPDTLPKEAQYVMNRIAGVLSFTDFAIHDVFHPVKVWPLIGVSGLEPKDEGLSMLARAHDNLS